jgi:hypothetical protein
MQGTNQPIPTQGEKQAMTTEGTSSKRQGEEKHKTQNQKTRNKKNAKINLKNTSE